MAQEPGSSLGKQPFVSALFPRLICNGLSNVSCLHVGSLCRGERGSWIYNLPSQPPWRKLLICWLQLCKGATPMVFAADHHPRLSNTEWFYPDQSGGLHQAGGEEWWKQEKCAQDCSGASLMQCPPGMTQFPEALPGAS